LGNAKYKQKHRELGLCVDCSEPVHKGYTRCLKHIRSQIKLQKRLYDANPEKRRARSRKFKALYIATGRCRECSAPLDPDVDRDNVTCSNCIEGIVTERLIHARKIV